MSNAMKLCTRCHRPIVGKGYHRTRKGYHHADCPSDPASATESELESVHCLLHNTGGALAGNTQDSDLDWFARRLYGMSNFGMGSVDTFEWSLSNEEFERLALTPERTWTGKRWETLEPNEREAWIKLARICLYALPHIAARIGHRFMAQANTLRILRGIEWFPMGFEI